MGISAAVSGFSGTLDQANDINVLKSSRNIPGLDVTTVDQLNALDICSKRKMLCTRQAMELLACPKEN